jgi:hypothetical protein
VNLRVPAGQGEHSPNSNSLFLSTFESERRSKSFFRFSLPRLKAREPGTQKAMLCNRGSMHVTDDSMLACRVYLSSFALCRIKKTLAAPPIKSDTPTPTVILEPPK